MCSDPLSGCRLKLARYDEQIRYFDSVAQEWWRNAYAPKIERDSTPGFMVMRLTNIVQPPDMLMILIGEMAHTLRSCLDQLMWQLVLRDGGQPGTNTQFPIFKTSKAFRESGLRMYSRRVGGAWVNQLSPTRFADLKRLQPYLSPAPRKLHPLWVLHSLSNIDKHRYLLSTSVRMGNAMIEVGFARGNEIPQVIPGPFKEGAIIARGRIPDPNAQPKTNMKINLMPLVVFGKGSEDIRGLDVMRLVRL